MTLLKLSSTPSLNATLGKIRDTQSPASSGSALAISTRKHAPSPSEESLHTLATEKAYHSVRYEIIGMIISYQHCPSQIPTEPWQVGTSSTSSSIRQVAVTITSTRCNRGDTGNRVRKTGVV